MKPGTLVKLVPTSPHELVEGYLCEDFVGDRMPIHFFAQGTIGMLLERFEHNRPWQDFYKVLIDKELFLIKLEKLEKAKL